MNLYELYLDVLDGCFVASSDTVKNNNFNVFTLYSVSMRVSVFKMYKISDLNYSYIV